MKRLQEQAVYVATLEPDFQKLSDSELQGKTAEFRARLERGELGEDSAEPIEVSSIVALSRPELREKLRAWRKKRAEEVLKADAEVRGA